MPRSPRHRHCVYVVLLSERVWNEPAYRLANPAHNITKPCVYVGMTGLDPDSRFDRHMAGVQANRFVLKYGERLMPELYEVYNPMPYDAARDLQPVGMISSQPQVFAVAANSPLRTLDDLVAKGKAQGLTAGNAGVGTLSHLSTELLNRKFGLQIMPVPYRGDALLIPDVASGNISLGVLNLPVALPLIQAGRLRALAVTSAQPVAGLPGVPLLRVLGDEFVITGWAAMLAAKNVPSAGIERFGTLLRAALADAGVREKFAAFGVTPELATPAQLREFLRAETARWSDVVRSRGIKLE